MRAGRVDAAPLYVFPILNERTVFGNLTNDFHRFEDLLRDGLEREVRDRRVENITVIKVYFFRVFGPLTSDTVNARLSKEGLSGDNARTVNGLTINVWCF